MTPETLEVQLARETLAAIDAGEQRADGFIRPRMGDAIFMSPNDAAALAQECINVIVAAGLNPYPR